MKLLLTDWLNKIDENFEKEFWIDQSNSSQYVNRRQIYKDTINSSLQWTDFQFRPNFLVAAVIVSYSFFLYLFLKKCKYLFKRLLKCLIKLIYG